MQVYLIDVNFYFLTITISQLFSSFILVTVLRLWMRALDYNGEGMEDSSDMVLSKRTEIEVVAGS